MIEVIIVLSIILLGFLFKTAYNIGYAQCKQDQRLVDDPDTGHGWL